ncbi:MAG TPA: hypothetical protein P5042_02660 [Candidatus Izemoplasmatales bacterium]|nr:hypothetical protein [Candidatus Izemoplasmatales bacterium]
MKIRYEGNGTIAKILTDTDPILVPIFVKTPFVEFETGSDYFRHLAGAIVTQQLSSRVADAIFRRLLEYTKNDLSPEKILVSPVDDLRSQGLSYRKAEYLKLLAARFVEDPGLFKSLCEKTDEEVTSILCEIKGIGQWTAEMFLMFTLGREDVFSAGDYGLKRALSMLYNRPVNEKEATAMAKKWQPYRSVVSHFLWHYLD